MTFYNSATEQYEHVVSPIQWQDNSWAYLWELRAKTTLIFLIEIFFGL
jgi:hypothetical protein